MEVIGRTRRTRGLKGREREEEQALNSREKGMEGKGDLGKGVIGFWDTETLRRQRKRRGKAG